MPTSYLITWTLFFLPLLFLPIFEDSFHFPKIIFFYFCVTLLILTNAIKIFKEKKIILPSKKLLFAFCFLLFAFLLSTLTSIHPPTSLFGIHHVYIGSLVHLLALFIFALSVLQINWQKKLFYQTSAYIAAAAGIASIFALVQFGQYFFDFGEIYRVRSTIGEPNRLALFLSASLPFSLFLFLKTKNKPLKLASFINSLLISTAILLTFSRTSWIALFLSFITLNLLYLKIKPLLSLRKIIRENKHYLIITVLLIAFSLPSLGIKAINRNLAVIKDLKTGRGSTNIRLQNWQVVLKTIKNREKLHQHFLGSGPSTITYTFLKNRPTSFNKNSIEKNWRTSIIRNQFLDILTNLGILGLGFFILVLAIFLSQISKNLKRLAKNPLFWPGFTSFLIIFFSSFFYYQTITTSAYFWFNLGLLTSLLGKKTLTVNKNFRLFFLALTIPLSLSLLFFLLIITLADFNCSRGNFEKAVRINPFNNFYKIQLAHSLLQQAEQEKNIQKAEQSIKLTKEAVLLNPLSHTNQNALQISNYRMAVVFGKKQFHQKALKAGERRIELDPSRADPYDTQGLIYLDLKNLKKALEYFKKAIEIDPDNLESYLHIGEALKQMGKAKEAIKYYEKALQKNPDWPFAQEELQKTKQLLDKE